MKRILFFVFIILLMQQLFAQGGSILYPDLTGQELIDQLRADYKPNHVLSYDNARDTMFAKIDNHGGNVTGVYSGYTISINPQADPSTDAYNQDMNTEHTWPQSMGADAGNAKSDLHHLYPVRAQVNSSRSNDPYGEINDSATDTWWRLDYSQSNVPTSFIDEYSEKDNTGYFEPREDHKGNAARSVFYWYTMYKEQADTNFFNIQKETLRQWNLQDEVDQAELDRSALIATYQDGKENPFVLDTTLVRRAYFTGSSGSGGGSDTTSTGTAGDIIITEIMQNPSAVYDSDGEWFEVYNTTSADIDINGWYIKDNDTDSHHISNGGPLLVPAHGYFVLGRNANSATNGGVAVDYEYSGVDLANGADEIVLFASDGTTEIDRVEYDGGPNWPDPSSASMYFTGQAADDNNTAANWDVSALAWDGSAGDAGSPGYGDIVAGAIGSNPTAPTQFSLGQNYPNPFNPTTRIKYQLAKQGNVQLIVYNTLGQKVAVPLNARQNPGTYTIVFDGSKLASGVYFYQLAIENHLSQMRKMILLR